MFNVVGDDMKNVKTISGITGRMVVVAALVLAAIAPSILAVVASAATATERSIALSNTSRGTQGVNYEVSFKAISNASAFVVKFCQNSPLISQECTAPAGFSAAGAASTTSGFTNVTGSANNVVVVGSVAASTTVPVSVVLSGINNPTAAGPIYARIVTFDNATNAGDYAGDNLAIAGSGPTGKVDEGGVAISITDTVGVSGVVLESMTFCVSGAAIADECVTTTPPVLRLGETVGSTIALTPNTVSTGSIYTQISTNAATGAVISLKSSATDCGGLKRAGAPTACDILPALDQGVTETEARFGVRTATATNTGLNPTGNLVPVTGSGYNDTDFVLNYTAGNTAGVTSTFGDKFLDTAGLPANGKNMELTFAASVTNNTPAGLYSTDLSMIATGKF